MEFFLRRGNERDKQSSTGQAETHSMQPMHSPVRTVFFVVILMDAGQVFSHFLQSMQVLVSRLTWKGPARASRPSRAP